MRLVSYQTELSAVRTVRARARRFPHPFDPLQGRFAGLSYNLKPKYYLTKV